MYGPFLEEHQARVDAALAEFLREAKEDGKPPWMWMEGNAWPPPVSSMGFKAEEAFKNLNRVRGEGGTMVTLEPSYNHETGYMYNDWAAYRPKPEDSGNAVISQELAEEYFAWQERTEREKLEYERIFRQVAFTVGLTDRPMDR